MQYTTRLKTPLGPLTAAQDEKGLCGLWFEGQKHFGSRLKPDAVEKTTELFQQTQNWLNLYFAGQIPDFSIPLHLTGTPFQKAVWKQIQAIPYGCTTTYMDIARALNEASAHSTMRARAVGQAVAANPISILVPCHRVLSAKGALQGYSGGLERKIELLKLEKILLI